MPHQASPRTHIRTGESAMRQGAPPLRIDTSHEMETLHRASALRGHQQLLFEGTPVPQVPGFRPLVMNGPDPHHHSHRLNHGGRPITNRQPYANPQLAYPAAWPVHQHHVRQHNANEESGGRTLGPLSGMPLHAQTQQGATTGVQRLQYPSTRPLSRPETHNIHRLDEGERQVAKLHEEVDMVKATLRDMKAQFAKLKQIVETNVEDITNLKHVRQDSSRPLDSQRQPTPFTRVCDRCQRRSVESANESDTPVLDSVEYDHPDVQVAAPRNVSVIATKRESSTQNLELQPRQRSRHESVSVSKRYNLRTRKKGSHGQTMV